MSVEKSKGVQGKRIEVHDDALPGLSLRVAESGAKSWSLRYRARSGAQRRLTLGGDPALTLAPARDEARKALGKSQAAWTLHRIKAWAVLLQRIVTKPPV